MATYGIPGTATYSVTFPTLDAMLASVPDNNRQAIGATAVRNSLFTLWDLAYNGGGGGGVGITVSYGEFIDTTNQVQANISIDQAITFNTTILSSGVTIVSGSQITVSSGGQYQITANFNYEGRYEPNTQGTDTYVAINGTQVPNTKSGQGVYTIKGPSYIFDLNAGDYIEFYLTGGGNGIYSDSSSAGVMPSARVVVTQLGSGIVGPKGPTGIQGPVGFQGVPGLGYQGFQGIPGPGFTGSLGPQGITGSLGHQGYQGYQGPGITGSLGPQGYQGYQGLVGQVGPTGTGNVISYAISLQMSGGYPDAVLGASTSDGKILHNGTSWISGWSNDPIGGITNNYLFTVHHPLNTRLLNMTTHGYNSVNVYSIAVYGKSPAGTQYCTLVQDSAFTQFSVYGVSYMSTGCAQSGLSQVVITFQAAP